MQVSSIQALARYSSVACPDSNMKKPVNYDHGRERFKNNSDNSLNDCCSPKKLNLLA